MNINGTEITITSELIVEWERQIAELETKIAAAKVLLAPPDWSNGRASQGQNFMGTLADLANEADKPVSKSEMKQMLRDKGLPEHQVAGTYFYLAIKNLKEAQRISVKDDGSLWRGSRRI